MLGMSDFVESLIKQRRNLSRRSSRAEAGTTCPSPHPSVPPSTPLAICPSSHPRPRPQLQHPPLPHRPTPLPALTLLAVLHCTILSQQAVQYLGAGRRQYGCSGHPRNSQSITRHSSPQSTGVQAEPLAGIEHVTCSVCPFSGTNADGNPSGCLYRMYLSSKRHLRAFSEADLCHLSP